MTARSYGQFCGLARALDVISGRWSLLIVRELLIGPARYGSLQSGLPGISTNLLSERLRELEAAGVVQRQLDSASNGVAYALTEWGQQLRAPIEGLVTWSTPLMVPGPQGDAFQPHWLVLALESLLRERRSATPVRVGLEVDATLLTVVLDESGPHVLANDRSTPQTVFRTDAHLALGMATGLIPVDAAIAAGDLRGDAGDLRAVFGYSQP